VTNVIHFTPIWSHLAFSILLLGQTHLYHDIPFHDPRMQSWQFELAPLLKSQQGRCEPTVSPQYVFSD